VRDCGYEEYVRVELLLARDWEGDAGYNKAAGIGTAGAARSRWNCRTLGALRGKSKSTTSVLVGRFDDAFDADHDDGRSGGA
jgi:hypothetical protein